MKIYVAGKVSKDSVFGTHYWRDDFVSELQRLSGRNLLSLDPTKKAADQNNPEEAFGADVYMISQADVVVVYLSDDISVGGAQEILIAKYYKKPVIGLAPLGGKFNKQDVEIFGQKVKKYIHPFVFATCDIVCDDIKAVSVSLKDLEKIKPKTIDIIPDLANKYARGNLKRDKYLSQQLHGS